MEKINDTNVKSALAGHTAKSLGISAAYYSLMQSGKRPVSVTMAELLGFDVVVTYVPRVKPIIGLSPAPDTENNQ